MAIIFAYSRKGIAKLKATGKTLDVLTLSTAINKAVAEKLADEKGISLTEAENLVVSCIAEGFRTMEPNR